MKKTPLKRQETIGQLRHFAEKRVRNLLDLAQLSPLRRKGPACMPWEVSVHFVNRPTSLALNSEYRGKTYATDVLSFSATSPFLERGWLGELVICLPILRIQAREWNHSVKHELEVLMVHGVMHLLGFDHERGPRAAKVMAGWEETLLKQLTTKSCLGLIDRTKSDTK